MTAAATSRPTWTLNIEATCERIMAEGVTCMICRDALADGHTRVSGGVFDGRLLVLHCTDCVPPVDDGEAVGRIKNLLRQHVQLGLLAITGGPGPNGEPSIIHGDHIDPWPTYPDDY